MLFVKIKSIRASPDLQSHSKSIAGRARSYGRYRSRR
jgi:hypothetical protein